MVSPQPKTERTLNIASLAIGIVAVVGAPALTWATFRTLTEHRLARLEASDESQTQDLKDIGRALSRIEQKVDDLRERAK